MVDFVALFLNFASKNRNLNFSQDENTVLAGVLVMYQVYTIFGTGSKNVFYGELEH